MVVTRLSTMSFVILVGVTLFVPIMRAQLTDPAMAGCYDFLSCYTDDSSSVDTRTLRYQLTSADLGGDANQTVENCADTCYTRGYSMMGLEYYSQCFCDDLIYSSSAAIAPFSDCNTPCKGNASEACGGPNRLSVYTLGSCSASSVTTASSATSAAVGTSASAMTSSVTSTVSSSATSVAAAIGSGFPSNAGYNFSYLGCYSDDPSDRTLRYLTQSAALGGDANMTIENCANICQSYTYMGLEYEYQCFCDNIIFNTGATLESSSDCNTPCNGNTNEMCGGSDRLLVYQNSKNVGYTVTYGTTVTTIATTLATTQTTVTAVGTANTITASSVPASISRASSASVASVASAASVASLASLSSVSVASMSSISAASARASASSVASAASVSIVSLQSVVASLNRQVAAASANSALCVSYQSEASVFSAASASQVRASISSVSSASAVSVSRISAASVSSLSVFSVSRASMISVISASIASVSIASISAASASRASASMASASSASRLRASISSASASSVQSAMSVVSASKSRASASSASVSSVLSVVSNNPIGYYRYVGCYHFGIVAPPLDTHILTPNLTLEACVHTCYSDTYMGVVMGTQCFCGNDLATDLVSADNCFGAEVNPCIGRSSETCGGFTGMAIYGRVKIVGTCPAPKVTGSTVTVACATVTGVK